MLRTAPYTQLHAAPTDAPPFHASTWAKANPSMRFLPSLKAQIKEEAVAARRDGVVLQSFKALRLNQGVNDTLQATLLEADVWARIEGEAERSGPYVLGIDVGSSTSQTAAAAYWPETGRLEGFAVFPERPSLADRAITDNAGLLYEQCARRGELLQAGEWSSDIPELLNEALERWGRPVALAADSFKERELRAHLKAMSFPDAALVIRRMGWRDGAEDVRGFRLAALGGHVTPVESLLFRASMAEARLVGDVAGNWKLARGSAGGRRSKAKDDVVAAAILAVAVGRRAHTERAGELTYVLAG